MSDDATKILKEQVLDELLDMPLSKFFALLDEYEFRDDYDLLSDILYGVVNVIVEERSL